MSVVVTTLSGGLDSVTLALRSREPQRPADVGGQRIGPRPLDEPALDRPAEEARHDAVSELHVTGHLPAVGKAQLQVPVFGLGTHGQQRRYALRVEERTLLVDQVVAAVATDAGELELDRVDRRQPQRLDGCERQPGDPRDGYSTSA